MYDMKRLRAGIISSLLAIVLVTCFYAILGTVDLVFIKEVKDEKEVVISSNEVARLEDVSAISKIQLTRWDIKDYEELEFTYGEGENQKDFADNFDLRFEIAKTVVINLVTFNWDDANQVIIFKSK